MDNTLPLSAEDKRAREEWAWEMLMNKDPVRSWDCIIFSDEKKWSLDGPDGFQTYWRDLRRPPRQTKRRQAGGGSVMVWAGISAAGKTKLAVLHGKQNSDDYVYTLSEFLLPFDHSHYTMAQISPSSRTERQFTRPSGPMSFLQSKRSVCYRGRPVRLILILSRIFGR
ncbi:hypothetical protein PC128_g12658 [Phytophthora cactorum]|nr:hypothetical protein PC128_g12658 [Phytophthora cactorum]